MPSIEYSVRDKNVIEHMLSYCDQLQGTLQEIEYDKNRFLASHTYQNAVAMCILQLGELAKQLSDEFCPGILKCLGGSWRERGIIMPIITAIWIFLWFGKLQYATFPSFKSFV